MFWTYRHCCVWACVLVFVIVNAVTEGNITAVADTGTRIYTVYNARLMLEYLPLQFCAVTG